MIFIDTDLAIGFLIGKKSELCLKAKQVLNTLFDNHEKVYLTIFNKAELIRGAYISSNTAKYLRIIEEFVERFEIVNFDAEALHQYAKIYADLKKKGENVGDFDELIASIVYSNEGILYTHNLDHFSRISLLQIVDWAELKG